MSEQWIVTTLGDVAHIQQGKTLAVKDMTGGLHPVYGANGVIGWYREGNFPQPTVALGCRGSCGTVHLTPENAFLANNVMAIWPRESDRVSLGFLALTLEASDLISSGVISGQVQPQITRSSLEPLKVTLPPLAVQRRIVDLMAHLDNHLTNLRAEREAVEEALTRLAVAKLALPTVSGTPMSDLLIRNIGGVWGEEQGSGDLTVDVFRSTEFTNLGYLSGKADARRDVTEGQYQGRALADGDILVEKSGGTPTRPVGRVVRVAAADLNGPAIGANFLQLLRVNRDAVFADYLFWVLWGTHRRGDAFDYQQASTNIRNLKTKEYLARRIELPPMQEQEEVGALLDAVLTNLTDLDAEAARLASLRGGLLSALLSAEVDIPDSYDALIAGVA